MSTRPLTNCLPVLNLMKACSASPALLTIATFVVSLFWLSQKTKTKTKTKTKIKIKTKIKTKTKTRTKTKMARQTGIRIANS